MLFPPPQGFFLTHCTYWTHHINQHFLSTPLWIAKAVVCFKICIKTVSALKWSNSSYLSNTSLRPKYFYGQPQNTIRFVTTAALTYTSAVPAWRVFLHGSWIFYVQTLQCVTQILSSAMDIHRVTNVGTPSESRACPTQFRNQMIVCGNKIFIVLHNTATDWLYFLPSPWENTGALCNFCSRLLRLQVFIFLTDFSIGFCLCKEPFGS